MGWNGWLFVGNEGGGRTGANLYSLSESCKAAGVDPREYLRDVCCFGSRRARTGLLTPYACKVPYLPEVEKHRDAALRRLFERLEH